MYALTYFMHHVCQFLETNDYVHALLLDFSKAFDVVNHAIFIRKILALDMPANINNWLISFFTGRTQVCNLGLSVSSCIFITRSIIQGSSISPSAYVIMEDDLLPKSKINILFKFADDTNLLVPQITDTSLLEEFDHIKNGHPKRRWL